jgi:hypothetical protein
MRVLRSLAALVFALCIAFVTPAYADDVGATIDSAEGTRASVTIRNPNDFAVKVAGVRLSFAQPDGTTQFQFSQPGWSIDIEPGQSWSGSLDFPQATGLDLTGHGGTSVAAGVDINALAAPAEAAAAGTDVAAMIAQRELVRSRVSIVSRSSRFHAEQIAASGVDAATYFDLERIDALVESLENALCEDASRQVIGAPNDTRRNEIYNELAGSLREIGLHITCINRDAKLSAARMLIASARPQDALLFKETDEEGNLLPEWRPIFITANLALATAAADLNVSVLSAIQPAIEALNEVYKLEPQHPELPAVAARVVPLASRWITDASGPVNRDLEKARELLELLRPNWDAIPGVMTAAAAFGDALIESGLAYCERREFINARNEFVRGERILQGVEQWAARAPEINRCRAQGALQEGIELANHPTDPDGPRMGFAKLEEAQGRFELTEQEINDFKAAVSNGWVAVANRFLDEYSFTGADNALVEAEAVSPTGATDAIRDAWIRYAEQRFAREGYVMSGVNITDARRALEKVGDYNPERVGAISRKLTMAYYSYRVGLPLLALLLAAFAGLYAVASKARAKRLATMIDND